MAIGTQGCVLREGEDHRRLIVADPASGTVERSSIGMAVEVWNWPIGDPDAEPFGQRPGIGDSPLNFVTCYPIAGNGHFSGVANDQCPPSGSRAPYPRSPYGRSAGS